MAMVLALMMVAAAVASAMDQAGARASADRPSRLVGSLVGPAPRSLCKVTPTCWRTMYSRATQL